MLTPGPVHLNAKNVSSYKRKDTSGRRKKRTKNRGSESYLLGFNGATKLSVPPTVRLHGFCGIAGCGFSDGSRRWWWWWRRNGGRQKKIVPSWLAVVLVAALDVLCGGIWIAMERAGDSDCCQLEKTCEV